MLFVLSQILFSRANYNLVKTSVLGSGSVGSMQEM